MKILFPTSDANILKEACCIVQEWMIDPNGTEDQKELLAVLRTKVEKSLSPGPGSGILEFDIFDAVRTFDLLENLLEKICTHENSISNLKIIHIVGMAILRTTLKYGIIR